MVGGGGGGGVHAGGRIGETFPNCLNLSFETGLMSPKPESLAKVNIGDVLRLALQQQQGKPLVVALNGNDVVGTIGSAYLNQLVECMGEDHQYVADVLSIEGGACRVRVHHAGK